MSGAEQALMKLLDTSRPLFVVRRRGCGHRLGAVHDAPGMGLVVAGRRQGAIRGVDGLTRMRAWYLQELERPSQPEWWGCVHAQGLLPLEALLARAKDRTRGKAPFLID